MGPGQQVLQGNNWQVKGPNGRATAHPSQPWGSTLTFQPIAMQDVGVSWAFGLRHGVAMHPRGRHLREGMILLYPWKGRTPERELQPQPQYDHNNWRRRLDRQGIEQPQRILVRIAQSKFQRVIRRRSQPHEGHQHRNSNGHYYNSVPAAKHQSEGIYCIFEFNREQEQELVEFLRDTKPFSDAEERKDECICRGKEPHNNTTPL